MHGIKAELKMATDELLKKYNDLGALTLTLNKPEDILFLNTATIVYICNNNIDQAEKMLEKLSSMASVVGPEKAVEEMVSTGREAGFFIPSFYKPLAIMVLQHALDKAKKESDESE